MAFLTLVLWGCNHNNQTQPKTEIIPLNKKCDSEKTALKKDFICPKSNIITDTENSYNLTLTIDSSEGYSNVRSNGLFSQEFSANVLTTLADKQQFCGDGPLKPFYDARGGETAYDENGGQVSDEFNVPGSLAYEVLLKDSNNEYCRGYISANLVKKGGLIN